MKIIDDFLNSMTMYKTVLYGLILLTICAFIASFMGSIPFPPHFLIFSLGTLVATCYGVNFLFAKLFKAPINSESYIITAFILFFLITPPINGIGSLTPLILASFFAMAAKYILAIKKKHLFNPAAIGAVIITLLGFSASWWIATLALIPATFLIGLLVIRKIRKFSLFLSFSLVVVIEMVIFSVFYQVQPVSVLSQLILSWPFLFFAAFMLTEPLTMPPTRPLQILYGAIVGFLFAFQLPLGFIHLSPELALVIGNVYSYFVSSKQRIILTLIKIEKLTSTIYSYKFKPSERLKFVAGQYVEWTLPHQKTDSRGNRRFFTIASSPTEAEIMLGVRIENDGSSFKKALLELKKDAKISIGSLAGDFTIPQNPTDKLVFVAGGIGITPFRSIVKYLLDTNKKRDIIIFHVCSRASDFVYEDVFDRAKSEIGLKIIHVLTEEDGVPKDFKGLLGHITKNMIKNNVADYKDRKYYISGSNIMVNSTKSALFDLKISPSQVITDYFSGY